MIITENSVALLEQVDQLVAALAASPLFMTYQQAQKKLAADPIAQKKITELQDVNTDFAAIADYGHYAPDYQKQRRKLRQLKREVTLWPTVAEFKRAEMDLQTALDEIGLQLADCISADIKVATGNPFYVTSHTKKHCSVKGVS
ncbi:YlbF family regulator [Loigolactobacillus zhaoyuanensis]|uniref:YlbF family regulator n=1 Tax=Loigolactobacillus zhaoyuanensis TaxID=2486017 RepID=A0ABW8U9X9_9LACO|nr:YlbF family regulator [Loigolactobacillus zhaoyuanensis]